jgi:hypothetical protein
LRIPQVGDRKGLLPLAASVSSGQQGSAEIPLGPVHVALVSEAKEISSAELARVSAALQKQVTRDLMPAWNVTATVEPFESLARVPAGYWPIIIRSDIGRAGAGGFHSQNQSQPFALVQYNNSWTLAASHELLDMLVDPSGNRIVVASSPNPADNGKSVRVLVEIAQPVEAAEFAYSIDGILVSDFVTPAFYNSSDNGGMKYSYTGAAKTRMKILKGGFLSWEDPATSEWSQEIFFGQAPEFRNLGKIN